MADEVAETPDVQISFKVRTGDSGTHSVTMVETATILDLKTKLSAPDLAKIPADQQRLIYSGRVMKDEDQLKEYKIKAGNTIHMVKMYGEIASRWWKHTDV